MFIWKRGRWPRTKNTVEEIEEFRLISQKARMSGECHKKNDFMLQKLVWKVLELRFLFFFFCKTNLLTNTPQQNNLFFPYYTNMLHFCYMHNWNINININYDQLSLAQGQKCWYLIAIKLSIVVIICEYSLFTTIIWKVPSQLYELYKLWI